MPRLILTLASASLTFVATSAVGQRERGELVTRSDPMEWRLTTTVTLGSRVDVPLEALVHCPEDPGSTTPVDMARDVLLSGDSAIGAIGLEQGTVYFPVADRSAAYEVDRDSLSARFLYNGGDIPLQQSLYSRDASGQPIHSGAAYGVWSFGPAERFVPTLTMQFKFEATSWNITLNEDAARAIAWPSGEWPVEARSSLEPMLFIDRGFQDEYDRAAIEQLVESWTRGAPRSQPPVVVAKWIAGQLATSFQPIGKITSADSIAANSVQAGRSVGAVQGLNATRLDRAAETMTGTPLDLALLLTALYREAGLPARVVVGFVAGDAGGARDPIRRSDEPEMGFYAWVEFALYDETQASLDGALAWIPVDIIAMRAGNVGRRPLDQVWDGFGRSDYLNQLIPLAYHLHPHRLPAVSYGVGDMTRELQRLRHGVGRREPVPSMWGWNLVPRTPRGLHQTIVVSATTPSRTGGDAAREGAERR